MNLTAMVAAGYRRAPGAVKGPVTFTDRVTLEEATSTGTFVPASGSPADSFKERETTRSKARRGLVEATPLAFAPAEGMLALWEGSTWSVLAVSPLDPSGSGTPVLYRVTLTK